MLRARNLTGLVFGAVVTSVALFTWPLVGMARSAPQSGSAWHPAIVPVVSPSASNSGEPQLTASDRGVILSWVEHDGSKTTLRFAERTPDGWTAPRIVASGTDWSVNAIDAPAVIRFADGTLVASWLQRSGSGMHANDVRLSYSKDGGRTWAPSFTPHPKDGQAQRLFASLFETSAGLGLVWLEGPPMSRGTGDGARGERGHQTGGEHAHQQTAGQHGEAAHGGRSPASESSTGDATGAMTLRFASFDRGWKQTAAVPIDLRVCECCSTAAVVTSDGVLAAYRNRSDDDIRDIYVSRFAEGGWSEPAVAHADNWRIPACPINGPAVSARGRDVAIAWYTVQQDQGHAYVEFSRDAGRTFGKPIRLDEGASLGRVDVEMLPDGSAVASWIETTDGRSQFRVCRVTSDGARSAAVTVAGLAAGRAGGVPRIARHGDELVVAWTETANGTPQVRTAVVRLPGNATP